MTREQALSHPAYWFEHEQNELFRQVSDYMEREKITRTELANRLKVSKGYVSQVLNGNYNYTLKKWIELCLAIGIVPGGYKKLKEVIQDDMDFAKTKKNIQLEKRASDNYVIPVMSFGNFMNQGSNTFEGGVSPIAHNIAPNTFSNRYSLNSFESPVTEPF